MISPPIECFLTLLGDSQFLEDETTKIFARKVADHYSARTNQTLEEREASPIIHLKKLNNWVLIKILDQITKCIVKMVLSSSELKARKFLQFCNSVLLHFMFNR